jgi:methylenetetrahydrofolate dehydrogenase (NADP+)/methenyltetrahydrofolate cyclohydrolase
VRSPLEIREPNKVSGAAILRDVRGAYQQQYRDLILPQQKKVAVIRFEAPPNSPQGWVSRMDASRISAEQKVKNIGSLGYEMQHQLLSPKVSEQEFSELLHQLNKDPAVSGVIVQFPPPPRLQGAVADLAPSKDIDALLGERSSHQACATADGIVRLAEPFLTGQPTVAVIGSDGFVGRGVVEMLGRHDAQIMLLEFGDDLAQLRGADVVISVTGNPRILGPEHLSPGHRLVVDSGFVPQPSGGVLGDVQAEASGIPQRITPVPGGIGPVEMAVLLERMVRLDANPALAPWRLVLPEGP